MEKNTTTTIAVAMLVIGLSLGYVLGTNKTSVLSNENQDGKMMHQMPGDTMMRNDNMSMSDMMSSMNAELKGKTGDAFDQAFLAEMIVHHEGAVEMANLALTNAKNQEIKSLSKAIISAQNSEISQMKGWQKSWYNQ